MYQLPLPWRGQLQHVACRTLRHESTWIITGRVAEVAAGIALKYETAVRMVNITALQATLRDQRQVIDIIPVQPEKCEHLDGPPEF